MRELTSAELEAVSGGATLVDDIVKALLAEGGGQAVADFVKTGTGM